MNKLREATEGYLKSASKGPYRDLVSQLMLAMCTAEGELQDLKADLRAYPIRMVLNADGSFIVDAEGDEWLEAFERMFLE